MASPLPEPTLDPRHAAVLAAFSGVMGNARPQRLAVRGHALAMLEQWALSDPGLGFGPTSAVDEQGRTLVQALLLEGMLDGPGDGAWLAGWIKRHGVGSVFGAACQGEDHPLFALVERWVGLCRDGQWQPMDEDKLQVLEALVAHAPDEAMDGGRVAIAVDQLVMAGSNGPRTVQEAGAAEGHARLARMLEGRAGMGMDEHTPLRWLPGGAGERLGNVARGGDMASTHWLEWAGDAELGRMVRTPSGRTMTLGALLDLRDRVDRKGRWGGLLQDPEREHVAADDLIDALVPLGRSNRACEAAAQALAQSGDPRAQTLRQAILWANFHQDVRAEAREIREAAASTNPFGGSYPGNGTAAAELARHVSEHGVLLDIGMREWRQWGRLGRDMVVAEANNPGLVRALAAVEAGVVARELDGRLAGPGRGRAGARM